MRCQVVHNGRLKLTDPWMQVVFVDVMDSIIEQLQKTKEYTVTEIGGEGEKVNKISNYRAINSKTHEADVVKEISQAEIVSPALYPYSHTISEKVPPGYLRCWT